MELLARIGITRSFSVYAFELIVMFYGAEMINVI